MVSAALAAPRAPAQPDLHLSSPVGTLAGSNGSVTVDVRGTPPPLPLFFNANAEQSANFSNDAVAEVITARVHVLQGKADTLTLGLSGEGEILSVSGIQLRDWSIRRSPAGDTRFIDFRTITEANESRDFTFVIKTRQSIKSIPARTRLLLLTSGEAVGFSSVISLDYGKELDSRVIAQSGLTPIYEGHADDRAITKFSTTGAGMLELNLTARGAGLDNVELVDAKLMGTLSGDSRSVDFKLLGQLVVRTPGARMRILSGRVALTREASGDGWHVESRLESEHVAHFDLVAERAGRFLIEFAFVAGVREQSGWRTLDFKMPAGAIVPLKLEGLDASWTFKSDAEVVPAFADRAWSGFLPPSGNALLAWSKARTGGEGALFFNSTERTEISVAAGIVRGSTHWSVRVLQGKLSRLRARLEGLGEIVGIEGSNLESWNIVTENSARFLVVTFTRPIETEANLVLQTQSELSSFPAQIEPLRLAPEGVIRHSGLLRIVAAGGVRLEVPETTGLMQLAPEKTNSSSSNQAARQAFAFRFPSSEYRYRVSASLIQAEVAVSQISLYRMADADRLIRASLELDVREASLREWRMRVPADFTVTAASGAQVADFSAESSSRDGYRELKINFLSDVSGRQLIQLELEKNDPASAGSWTLQPLLFPGAKSVRGSIGVSTTAGFRVNLPKVGGLVEVPLNYFPQQIAGLQQAWRVRDESWQAVVQVEALGQSIQADVFHLYSVRDGVVSGSVLLNYFVVGAPATEWRLNVPKNAGNIDVVGLNVRRDWRREGDQIVVALHQPALGNSTLLVTFEQPLKASGGEIELGRVQPVGVRSERGFIEVVSALQLHHEVKVAEGALLRIEASELPAEFRLLATSPALEVFQYTTRPFAATLSLRAYAPTDAVEQVVDFARFSTSVSSDGQAVTEAQYFVKARGRKSMRFSLPDGVKLWDARVGGVATHARLDGVEYVIPLPPRIDSTEPVTVVLRLGHAAQKDSSSVALAMPKLAMPIVSTEWILRPDADRSLIPVHATSQLTGDSRAENGFVWVSDHAAGPTLALLGFLVAAGFFLGGESRGFHWTGVILVLLALGSSGLLLADARQQQRQALHDSVTYTGSLVPAGGETSANLRNVPRWSAGLSRTGASMLCLGMVLLLGSAALKKSKVCVVARALAIAAIGVGTLDQPNGAFYFYGFVGLGAIVLLLLNAWRTLNIAGDARRASTASGPALGGAGTLLGVLGALVLFGLTPKVSRADVVVPRIPNHLENFSSLDPLASGSEQSWTIRGNRLDGVARMTFQSQSIGDRFLVLNAPAVLADFQADGLRLAKVERDGVLGYFAIAEKIGTLRATVKFNLSVAPETGIVVPTGPAAAERITVEIDQGGWSFSASNAIQVVDASIGQTGRSAAVLVLQPQRVSRIVLQPRGADETTEAKKIFIESAELYLPAPGTVTSIAHLNVRPVQGHVSELNIDLPEGWAVADVAHGPIRSWQFDGASRRLRVTLLAPQSHVFDLEIQSQLAASRMPFNLSVEPLRVSGATAQAGLLAVAFGSDAQSEAVRAERLSIVNPQDFDDSVLAKRAGEERATIQSVWRFAGEGARLSMRIVGIAPEVRVASKQVVTFDDDRLLIEGDLRVAITRVGLFQLSFLLPNGLEIDSLTGPSLAQWTESKEGGGRLITLHLNGRTLGEQNFALTLSGTAPHGEKGWSVPHLDLREATRQATQVLVVPGKGIRLQLDERNEIVQVDARAVGGMQPGALAFRSLQEKWSATIGIEQLEPWLTLQALTEMTLREGQSITRIGIRYRVENAPTKTFRIKLLGLSDEQIRTVRASGAQVSEIVRESEGGDVWVVHFKRTLVGETDLQIEFQGSVAAANGLLNTFAPTFPDARQVTQFLVLRTGGRLEVEAKELPANWQRTDWSAVPASVQDRANRSVPTLCFRVAETEHPLSFSVRTQALSDSLKLRVQEAKLLTLLSTGGSELTAVELQIEVLESSVLRLRLPDKARLFSAYVNGQAVAVVSDGDAILFNIAPAGSSTGPAQVRLIYSVSTKAGQKFNLLAPTLSTPLQNVSWRVLLPDGFRLADFDGGLRLVQRQKGSQFGLDSYQLRNASEHSVEAQRGIALLREANSLMQRGEQERAGEILGRAALTAGLDEASNEDARVQLRNLKTQQTMLGLTTRRQRLYLDNRVEAAKNESLEQAVTLNPFMQGKVNFDPRQFDQLLQGNSQDENAALRGIAGRMVDQQLALSAAPGAIDVTMPERGEVVEFNRSIQGDGSSPLSLRLKLVQTGRSKLWVDAALIALLGLAFLLGGKRYRLREPKLETAARV